MRIAIFHNLPSGGGKRALYEWTRRLVGTHEIDGYTLSSADHDFCDIRPFIKRYHIYNFIPRKLYDSPFGRLNQFLRWRDLGDLINIGQRIAEDIDGAGYDVVFANTCLYTFIPTFLQFVGIPSAYYLHEPFGRHFARQFERPYLESRDKREHLNRFDPLIWLYRRRFDHIQEQSIRRTKLFLANSQYTREQMKIGFSIDAPVSPLGVDSDSFRPLPGIVKENAVISVGELSPRKGFDFLIESLANIPPDQRPQLRLACNSVDPDEQDYIQYLADQIGVELQVLTNLNTEDLVFQYNLATLCIYAPIKEPFGLVPLEAMACGTPVVGVQEGGVREIIVNNRTGILVERDPVLFAEAILSLLTNPEKCARFGQQAREYSLAEWGWEKSTATLEEFLISISID